MGKYLLGILKKWAKGELVLFVIAASVALMSGCSDGNTGQTSETIDQVSEAQTYRVTGRVRSITPDRDFIMVKHDAIEGFMDAMTMPFGIQDTTIITGLAPGDSLSFEITVSAGDVIVRGMEIR